MSYGSPTDTSDLAEYFVRIKPDGLSNPSFEVRLFDGSGMLTGQQKDAYVQDFIDFIAGSAEYDFTEATKTYGATEAITAT